MYTISWGAATGLVTRYELEESKYSTFPACAPCPTLFCPKICSQATFQPYIGPALSFVVNGKISGTYYYQVRACNDTGCSAFFPIQPTGQGAPAADANGIVVTIP